MSRDRLLESICLLLLLACSPGAGRARCASASECRGEPPAESLCSSGWSCIENRCVWECAGGRTCQLQPDSGCLSCSPAGQIGCPAGACSTSTRAGTVDHATCAMFPGASQPLQNAPITVDSDDACRHFVSSQSGGATLGSFEDLSGGAALANFPGLGGVCTGQYLSTNAFRILFSCLDCQLMISW